MSRYTVNGWDEDLPKLRTGRRHHGCGHFFSETNGLVKIIIIKKMNTAGDQKMVIPGLDWDVQLDKFWVLKVNRNL